MRELHTGDLSKISGGSSMCQTTGGSLICTISFYEPIVAVGFWLGTTVAATNFPAPNPANLLQLGFYTFKLCTGGLIAGALTAAMYSLTDTAIQTFWHSTSTIDEV